VTTMDGGSAGTAGRSFRSLHDETATTEAKVPDDGEQEVIDLLALNPDHRRLVRLDQAMWGHVHDIAAALAAARGLSEESA
jgi:hypothetical protein